jgi:hypothetical protein
MKKNKKTETEKALDSLEMPSFSAFIAKYFRIIMYSIAFVMISLLLIYRVASTSSSKAEHDYLSAASEYAAITTSHDKEKITSHLKNLQDTINRRAELHQKYDGLIAQTLLSEGLTEKASDYMGYALDSLEDAPYLDSFKSFSEISLLVSEEKYEEALTASYNLKKTLSELTSEESSSYKTLYDYNLIRIAFLEQEIGSTEKELLVWQEVEDRVYKEENISSQHVADNFNKNNISLLDYINERKDLISR